MRTAGLAPPVIASGLAGMERDIPCSLSTHMAWKGAHISLGFPACRFLKQCVVVLLLETLLLGELTLNDEAARCPGCLQRGGGQVVAVKLAVFPIPPWLILLQ